MTAQGWAQIDQRGSLEIDAYAHTDDLDPIPGIALTLIPSNPLPALYNLTPAEARSLAQSLWELADQVEAAGG